MSAPDLRHLLGEDLGRRLPSEAFARSGVHPVGDLSDVGIGHLADVSFSREPAPGMTIGVLDGTFPVRRLRIAKPTSRPGLGLEVRPGHQLRATIERDGTPGGEGQGTDRGHDLAHHQTACACSSKITAKRLTRPTSDVTFACPNFCRSEGGPWPRGAAKADRTPDLPPGGRTRYDV